MCLKFSIYFLVTSLIEFAQKLQIVWGNLFYIT